MSDGIPTIEQKRRLAWLRWVALGVALLLVAVILVTAFPEYVLCVDSGSVKGDVIVMLGGGGGERPRRAAELFAAGAAPGIIVSGDGDTESNRRQLIAAGVPPEVIALENKSRNTLENAEATVRMLRERRDAGLADTGWTAAAGGSAADSAPASTQIQPPATAAEPPLRVIVVTSWYHSRRALNCFEHAGPEMQFYSRPAFYDYPGAPGRSATRPKDLGRAEREAVAGHVRSEYIKLLGYWVRYGIGPW
jgi:uncharacterized SAM-binding protein YcdF (DUF218 family)